MLKEFDTWYKVAFIGAEEVVEEEDVIEEDKDLKKDKTTKVCVFQVYNSVWCIAEIKIMTCAALVGGDRSRKV